MTPAIRPQPHEASDSPPTPSAAHPGAQIAAGVAGSVAVTLAAETLVVLVAFALTYEGFSLYDAAAGKQTFPRPGPTPAGSPTPEGGGGPRARVSPLSLPCTPEQCGQVQIASVGDAAFEVGDIRFEDDQAGFTHEDTCVGRTLEPGDSCTFAVGITPSSETGTRSATLLVPTSDGRVARVQLEGGGGEPAEFGFDGPVTCELGAGTAATLRFTLTGPEGTSPSVDTSVSEPSPQPVRTQIVLPVDLGATPPVSVDLLIVPGPEFVDDAGNNTETVQCG